MPTWVGIFFAFLMALLASMLLAAALSPSIQALLAPIDSFPLHRVYNRLTMLGVIAFTVWLLIRYRLSDRRQLGYIGPAATFLKKLGVGLLIGLAIMSLALAPLFALDLRDWNERLPGQFNSILILFLKGIGTGLSVALIEETFFRGALQGALTRHGAWRAALFAVPAFYSVVHFFGKSLRIPQDQVTASSGFDVLASYFSLLGRPSNIWDAFLALYLVGLLLAIMRHRLGDLAACIGLHAGFVAIIAVFRKVSSPSAAFANGESPWAFMIGPFDGLLGLWIAVFTGAACIMAWRWLKPSKV